tara:strand:+ start:355 stop:555 length:201 start_codon:yes stop_codon:yes gene_type:complete
VIKLGGKKEDKEEEVDELLLLPTDNVWEWSIKGMAEAEAEGRKKKESIISYKLHMTRLASPPVDCL